jgi:hypothetical protein
MSQEELAMKKRALNHIRLDLAKKGISADPYLRIEEEDLVAEIRAIEKELGRTPTPTLQERRATSVPPRYVEQEEPPQVFRERMVGQDMSDRRENITHQRNLLSLHRKHLGFAREQLRELGSHAPPYVRSGVQDRIHEIARIKGILRDMGQAVEDLPDDE